MIFAVQTKEQEFYLWSKHLDNNGRAWEMVRKFFAPFGPSVREFNTVESMVPAYLNKYRVFCYYGPFEIEVDYYIASTLEKEEIRKLFPGTTGIISW